MFRHPFESEWNQVRHEREVNEWVHHRQFNRERPPQHRIRRVVGRSIVSIGRRVAAEPAHEWARSR